jgi:hypothetical protein
VAFGLGTAGCCAASKVAAASKIIVTAKERIVIEIVSQRTAVVALGRGFAIGIDHRREGNGSQNSCEGFTINLGLVQNPTQGPRRKFRVQRNDAANCAAFCDPLQNDMTAALSNPDKAKLFKSSNRLGSGDAGKLRHTLLRTS